MITVEIIFTSDQIIHTLVTDKTTHHKMVFIVVYGLHSIEDRKPLWNNLHNLDATTTIEWIVMGDFNSVLCTDDRINGVPISNAETSNFRQLLDSTRPLEVKGIGESYTWSNKRQGAGRIYSRIDRCLCNTLWKWLQVEESILKQKSRIQWIQVGDSNSIVFFDAMKERHARNSIDVLYSSNGTKLEQATDI
ncbi:uncharacterized protein LOC125493226 [Beta vulgaris subsp. vulgaris]|uniref:uncharacterized protein LOC125493226 n=1 Tax=Beta vulgaris subsp. vulgaris TaxID=3555 RepID=UPI00203715C2|nr:uncharacterized protein LOC125493226 [Beta vulgaris subsp. vulgaris]